MIIKQIVNPRNTSSAVKRWLEVMAVVLDYPNIHFLPQKTQIYTEQIGDNHCKKISVVSAMKKILLYLQSIFYIAAGFNHFRKPLIYETLIPPYFPWHETINVSAGIAEIVLGAGLLFIVTRRWAAYGIVLLLLLFIPAHIYHIQMNGCLPGLCFSPWIVWMRLLILHPILIAWAWWYRKT